MALSGSILISKFHSANVLDYLTDRTQISDGEKTTIWKFQSSVK